MKKIKLIAILLFTNLSLVANFCCDNCECKGSSHTDFVVRPLFQSASPEKVSLFHDRKNIRENGHGGTLQLTLFGGRSDARAKLATFFTPFCKQTLLVKEKVEDYEPIDIFSQHFNVTTKGSTEVNLEETEQNDAFESIISFCPRQSVFGIGFTYRQNISALCKNCNDLKENNFWFELSTPLTRVENKMCLQEKIINDGGGASTTGSEAGKKALENKGQTFFASMQEAFKQKQWKYGKIDNCCKMVKWRLADIELKFGACKEKEILSYSGYIGILIPTGNRPSARYVFEPIVGHRKHFGITTGGTIDFDIHESDNHKVLFLSDIHIQYLFSSQEKRSFDLKYKPWSRYMEVYKDEDQAWEAKKLQSDPINDPISGAKLSTPGINVFTQCLDVHPGFSLSINNALQIKKEHVSLEIGGNLYFRQAECVNLCNWEEGPALKAGSGEGSTNKERRINLELGSEEDGVTIQQVEHYNLNIIKKSDIDLDSASHPAVLSFTPYITAGSRWDERDYPIFIGIGGSYEFGKENVVLNRWILWGKIGLSF